MEKIDSPEYWTDHFTVYQTQLSPDSKVKVLTETGSEYVFQKCCDPSSHPLITDNHVIITSSSNQRAIGRFGFPIGGFERGKKVVFCDGHGMSTSPIRQLKGLNIGPDLVHEHVIALISAKFRARMLELLQEELKLAGGWSFCTNIGHFFDCEGSQYPDDNPVSVQTKVSALVMDIMKGDFIHYLQHPGQLRPIALDLSDFVTCRMWKQGGNLVSVQHKFDDLTLKATFQVPSMNVNLLEVV